MKSKQMWVVTLTEKGRKPILTDFVFSRWKSAAIADLIKFFNGTYTWEELKEHGYAVVKIDVRVTA